MIKVNNVQYNWSHYPDGTLNMSNDISVSRITNITWLYENQEEQIVVFNLVKWLRKNNHYKVDTINLLLPYLPNARMDRIDKSNPCEIFTLKYFCEFINELHFDTVEVLDAHSNVSLALINNIQTSDIQNLIDVAVDLYNPDIVFYPDEGAMKRYSKLLNMPYCFGIKNRDWQSGKILGLDVIANGMDIINKKVLIIDDICSKGGTFYNSAKKLRGLGAKDVALYVSHCENNIFKGEFADNKVNLLDSGMVSHIYTTDSILTEQDKRITYVWRMR